MAVIKYVRLQKGQQEYAPDQGGYLRVYVERPGAVGADRPALNAMLEYLREGDVVEVESYSQIADSTRELLSIVVALSRKGIGFISRKENIDTTDAQVSHGLSILTGLLEFEEECRLGLPDGGAAAQALLQDDIVRVGGPSYGVGEALPAAPGKTPGFGEEWQREAYRRARICQEAGEDVDLEADELDALETAAHACDEAVHLYAGLAVYGDCLARMTACERRRDAIRAELNARMGVRAEEIYRLAAEREESGEYALALTLYASVGEYKDSEERVRRCRERLLTEEAPAAAEPLEAEYEVADVSAENEPEEAEAAPEHAAQSAEETAYRAARENEAAGKLGEAMELYAQADGWSDSAERRESCYREVRRAAREEAEALEAAEDWAGAAALYRLLQDDEGCAARLALCEQAQAYERAREAERSGDEAGALEGYAAAGGYRDSAQRADALRQRMYAVLYETALGLEEQESWGEAAEIYQALGDYQDSAARLEACRAR